MPRERLRVLTWHVHGNYLYYLTQAPHEFFVVANAQRSPGYAGKWGRLPWGDNVHDAPVDQIRNMQFDCVLYQSAQAYREDRHTLLSAQQRRLPSIYLEHDPPQQHPTNTRHPVEDANTLLVHVTHFNALMWDSGRTPTAVIEHGVLLPDNVAYTGDLPRGIVVVNNLKLRGRRLGVDVFEQARAQVPLDLVGMGAQELGGLGEVPNLDLPGFAARYRFFFNPIRYTSLGLAVIEAMMSGMPVVGLATTELAAVIDNNVNGYIDTNTNHLISVMQRLIDDPAEARQTGQAASHYARERFGIERFAQDWSAAFARVV